MKQSLANHTIGLDKLNDILTLDNMELVNQVVLQLHQAFETYATYIVEINHAKHIAHPIAYAQNGYLQTCGDYDLRHGPCELVGRALQSVYLYPSNLNQLFPDHTPLQPTHLEAYIGVPLKNNNEQVMGILISTFKDPIEDTEQLSYWHQSLANLVVHNLRSKWLQERSDKLVNQLSYEVSHDNLTHLLNRSSLSDKLEALTVLSSRSFTLVYLDIDNFKAINNINGSYLGDKILKFTARCIIDCISDPQLAFRMSGDEFAFITYDENPIEVCERILQHLESGYKDSTNHIKFTSSIGFARFSNRSMDTDQLILNANFALKSCKQHPNIQVQCYDTHLSSIYQRKTQLIEAIRHEINKPLHLTDQMYVVVQPIVKREQAQWQYFEVLIRWNSPIHGVVSAIELIQAAEQSGLIIPLGERIIELACQAKQTLEQGLGYKVHFGLNCSAHELTDSTRYLLHLSKTLAEYQFSPSEFTLELTETVLLSDSEDLRITLNTIRNQGFKVALDDFGTGYSSLNYIHSYPIDCIKIDASFVRNMLTNKTAEHVIKLIIKLAHQLEVNLIAEGVETQQALDKLYALGCEQIQGYYFSRPEKPDIILEYWQNMQRLERQ